MGEEVLSAYIVATMKDWNISNFHRLASKKGEDWWLIDSKKDLTLENISLLNPRYIFFPHWSWIIPKEIYSNFECIVFHMTDLPFGRGGSPLQNLIARGIYETKVTAIKVVEELDAGAVYLKRPLCLHGNAEEIFIRASNIVFNMIEYIVQNEPTPQEQEGKSVVFKRRIPTESRLPDVRNLNKVFDWIRMLDAEGYPKAFIETENLGLEFSRASLKSGHIIADVEITVRSNQGE